jgi:hypothetical protein
MAFTTFFKLQSDRLGTAGSLKKIYGFHFRVTTFGGGERLDVMVLQALFRIFYYEFMNFGSIAPPAGSTGIIKVDGIVGKQTRIHIQHYQQHLKFRGATATTDGVIDPFKKQGTLTAHTQKRFQLEALNGDCLKLAVDNKEERVHQEMIDPSVHGDDIYTPDFRAALLVPQFLV